MAVATQAQAGAPKGTDCPAAVPVDVESLQARGIRYAAVSFVDLHGKTKAKMVPVGHLQHAASGSELFTGAALDGVPQEETVFTAGKRNRRRSATA